MIFLTIELGEAYEDGLIEGDRYEEDYLEEDTIENDDSSMNNDNAPSRT